MTRKGSRDGRRGRFQTGVGCLPPVALLALVVAMAPLSAAASTPSCGVAPGDCDGVGGVTIDELQRAVLMKLGLTGVACGVDSDGDGTVSQEELDAVASSLLGYDSRDGGAQVDIQPAWAMLGPGDTVTFTASTSGCGLATEVVWSLEEGGAGGTLGDDGVYTAPGEPGTYHVVATSEADPTVSAAAAVTVVGRATILEQTVGPSQLDQTIEVADKLVVTIPGEALESNATLRIVELTGIPTPTAHYSVLTPWFELTLDDGPLPETFLVTLQGVGNAALAGTVAATASETVPIALTYEPPAFLELPSWETGTGSAGGQARVASRRWGWDPEMTPRGRPVAGAAKVVTVEEKIYESLYFTIHYYDAGPAAVLSDTDYEAENSKKPDIPNFIEDVGAYLDRAYEYFVRTLEANNIDKKSHEIYVGAHPCSEWSWKSGYIYVATAFKAKRELTPYWTGKDHTMLAAELAHELGHALQNTYRWFVGMHRVRWLGELLADLGSYRLTPDADHLCECKMVNFTDSLRYRWWDFGETPPGGEALYVSCGFLRYLDQHEPTRALDIKRTLESTYTAATSGLNAADEVHLKGLWHRTYADWLRRFYLDDRGALFRNQLSLAKDPKKVSSTIRNKLALPANRIEYENDTPDERTFQLGWGSVVKPMTGDILAIFPNIKRAGIPASDRRREFSVELLTDLARHERALLCTTRVFRTVACEEMPRKGQARLLALGAKEAADSAYVLVVNPNRPSEQARTIKVLVRPLPLIVTVTPDISCVDREVTVSGYGFGAGDPPSSQVLFSREGGGTVAATDVKSWTDTEITVRVPLTAVTGPLVVTRPGGGQTMTSNEFPFIASQVSVTVNPNRVTLGRGESYTFTAGVACGTTDDVSWSVREPGGGTVTTGGEYTAPDVAGVYHVVATSVADPARSDDAEITVVGGYSYVSVSASANRVAGTGTGCGSATFEVSGSPLTWLGEGFSASGTVANTTNPDSTSSSTFSLTGSLPADDTVWMRGTVSSSSRRVWRKVSGEIQYTEVWEKTYTFVIERLPLSDPVDVIWGACGASASGYVPELVGRVKQTYTYPDGRVDTIVDCHVTGVSDWEWACVRVSFE